MGTSLSGLTPATTFDGLLKVGDNDPLTATLKAISTGDGTDTILSLSNSALHIGGSATNETTDTWVEGFNSNLRLSANSPSMQFKDTSGTAGFMIGVSGASTFFSQSTNADFTAVSYVGKITGGKWNFGSSDTPTATVSIKGSGATSATTSLLVQNSAGTDMLKVQDDSSLLMYRAANGAELLKITESGGNAILYANGNANRSLVLGYQNTLTAFNQTEFKTYNGTGYSEAMVITGNSNTNQFVGIGETTPTARLHVKGSGTDANTIALRVQNSAGTDTLIIGDDGFFKVRGGAGVSNLIRTNTTNNNVGIGLATPDSASRMHIQGKGATSATTALLVQNSAGTTALEVLDNRDVKFNLGSYQFLSNGFTSFPPVYVVNNARIGLGSGGTDLARLHIKGSGNTNTTTSLLVQNSDGATMFSVKDSGFIDINPTNSSGGSVQFRGDGVDNLLKVNANDRYVSVGANAPSNTRFFVKGSGATSATTALLVQNSAGTEHLKVTDDGMVNVRSELFVNHPSISSRYLGLSWGAIGTNSTGDEFSLYGGGGNNGSIMYLNGSTKSAAPQAIGMKTTGVLIAPSMVQSSFAPNDSAQLQVDSTTKGFLPPRMTDAERDAIATPAAGLMIYDTTNNQMNYWNGSTWIAF